MKQSQHTEAVLAEALFAGRAAAAMDPGIAAQSKGDGPGASEDTATASARGRSSPGPGASPGYAAPASARGPCPALHDAGISRVVGDLRTPPPTPTVLGEPRAESREPRAESREPRAESREPRAESREPRAESREPRAESREPRAESREPRAESREPRAESREPRVMASALVMSIAGARHAPAEFQVPPPAA